jgi:hypothetical protein
MTKAAVIALADTETHGDLARVVNAMMTAKEFAGRGRRYLGRVRVLLPCLRRRGRGT